MQLQLWQAPAAKISIMATMTYDTLSASKRLIAAGADEKLAETVVAEVISAVGDDVVRKSDLQDLATKADLALLEERLGARILWAMIGSAVATTALLSFIIGAFVLIQD